MVRLSVEGLVRSLVCATDGGAGVLELVVVVVKKVFPLQVVVEEEVEVLAFFAGAFFLLFFSLSFLTYKLETLKLFLICFINPFSTALVQAVRTCLANPSSPSLPHFSCNHFVIFWREIPSREEGVSIVNRQSRALLRMVADLAQEGLMSS